MRTPLVLLALAAGCASDPATDPLAGEWSVTRTFTALTQAPPEDGEDPVTCPEVTSFGGFRLVIDPGADPQVTGPDGEGRIEEDGTVSFVMLDEVGGYETLAGYTLRYDEEIDLLIGSGSVGCASGCTYQLTVDATRADE